MIASRTDVACMFVFGAVLCLLLSCSSKPNEPEREGTLLIRVRYESTQPLSQEEVAAFARMVATVSGPDDSTLTLNLARTGVGWSVQTDVTPGSYTVKVSAFHGDRLSWLGTTAVEVIGSIATDALVPLRWLAPTDLQASQPEIPGSIWVDLAWHFSDRSLSHFTVARVETVTGDSLVATVTTTRHYDPDVAPGALYRYRIAAVDTMGLQGTWSAPITVKVPWVVMPPDDNGAILVPAPTGSLDLPAEAPEVVSGTWLMISDDRTGIVVRPDGRQPTPVGPGRVVSWSPDGRLALFSDGNAVYSYAPESQATRPVTPGGRFRGWSPDGERLLIEDGSGATWVHDLSLGTDEHFSDGSPFGWSPDGALIGLFFRSENLEAPSDLYVAPSSGGGAPLFLGSGSPEGFSSDGLWVAYIAGNRRAWQYHVVRTDGTQDRLIARSSYDAHFLWSSDGSRALHGEGFSIGLITLEDGSDIALAEGLPTPVAWSPTGDRVAYLSHKNPTYLQVISADGSLVTRLAQVATDDRYSNYFSWSPDGHYLAACLNESTETGTGIYIINPDTGARLRVADGTGVKWSPMLR